MEQKQCPCEYRRGNPFCISSIRLFRDIPHELQADLVQKAIHTDHEKGSYLALEGDGIESVLIIRCGKVKICHTDASGEEHILDVLHDGQAIWHGIFLKEHYYHYDVVCLTDVKLCQIPRGDLLDVFHRNPQMAMNLLEMLSVDLDDAEEKILLLSIREPKKRVAEFLLHRDTRCLGNEIHLKLEDIASSINLRTETVSRNLAFLEREGMIERVGRGRLKILHKEELKRLAEKA
ncbi:MAG: Crp/Fnr family transcriptional regulator [Eubacterium sp.]|jgi:CRP/FNR family transcriptional regulator|nr:Crp/Fnr family transcriptional regulator [Eubacterium sp.]